MSGNSDTDEAMLRHSARKVLDTLTYLGRLPSADLAMRLATFEALLERGGTMADPPVQAAAAELRLAMSRALSGVADFDYGDILRDWDSANSGFRPFPYLTRFTIFVILLVVSVAYLTILYDRANISLSNIEKIDFVAFADEQVQLFNQAKRYEADRGLTPAAAANVPVSAPVPPGGASGEATARRDSGTLPEQFVRSIETFRTHYSAISVAISNAEIDTADVDRVTSLRQTLCWVVNLFPDTWLAQQVCLGGTFDMPASSAMPLSTGGATDSSGAVSQPSDAAAGADGKAAAGPPAQPDAKDVPQSVQAFTYGPDGVIQDYPILTDINHFIRSIVAARDLKFYARSPTFVWNLRSGIRILGLWMLPALYGALGGAVFYLRRYMTTALPNPKLSRVFSRMALGSLAGIVTTAIWSVQTAEGRSVVTLSSFMLSFLVGYGIEVFFRLLDRLVAYLQAQIANTNLIGPAPAGPVPTTGKSPPSIPQPEPQ